MTLAVDILVHISGPCRGTDDARYRKEALGFLNFEALETHSLLQAEQQHDGGESIDVRQCSKVQAEEFGQKQSPVRDNRTECEHTPHRRGCIDADNRGDVLPRAFRTPYAQFATPSITRPTQDPALQKTAINETPHILIARTPALPQPGNAPAKLLSTRVTPSLRRTQSDSWQTPPSVIPDSQPTPRSTSLPEISSSPMLKRPFFLSSSPSPTRPSESPPRKRAKIQTTTAHASDLHVATTAATTTTNMDMASSSEEPPASVEPESPASLESMPSSSPSPTSSSPPPSTPYPREIHPPHPKPSNEHFKTHVTQSLTTLSTKLLKYYKPQTSTRPLFKSERGHWLLPLATFDSTLLTKFWDFLSKFIGQGQAGFGTRCFRETVDADTGTEIGSDKENQPPRKQKDVAKIYCFGEVVGEIWIVLFLATERKIKGVGAKWIDASGEAVVIMN